MINVEDYLYIPKHVSKTILLEPTCLFDRDDMYSQGCIGLLNAVKSFKEDLTTFKKFAYLKVKWEIYNGYRNQFPLAHGRYDPDILKIKFQDIDDYVTSEYAFNINQESEHDYLEDIIKSLTPKERLIIRNMYYEGYTGVELSKLFCTSQKNISLAHVSALRKMKVALQ